MYTELVARQRQFFATGKTIELSFRMEQLAALKHALVVYEHEIIAALAGDLGKPEFSAYKSEIWYCLN